MAGKTGPTSPEGKAKASRNALKHGIRASKWLHPDEQRDFEALAADLHAEYQPSTATQRILVERIAMCMSKLRRLHVIEDALFHKARVQDVRNLTDRYTRTSDMSLEEAEAAAMPPFPQVDVLPLPDNAGPAAFQIHRGTYGPEGARTRGATTCRNCQRPKLIATLDP